MRGLVVDMRGQDLGSVRPRAAFHSCRSCVSHKNHVSCNDMIDAHIPSAFLVGIRMEFFLPVRKSDLLNLFYKK